MQENSGFSFVGLFTTQAEHELVEEVLKMQDFHHNHVMSLTGVCLDGGAGPAIVMPYMAHGSLLDYLRGKRVNILLDEDASPEKVQLYCMVGNFLQGKISPKFATIVAFY